MASRTKNARYSRILVIEHERIIAMDLERIMRSFGYGHTILAFSNEEALMKLKKVSPDLVFIDKNLEKGTDGIEIERKLSKRPRIQVIYISSMPEEGAVNSSKNGSYLKMPFSEKDIHDVLERTLHRK